MPVICRAFNSFYLLYNQRILQKIQTPPKINIKIIVSITHIQDNRISLIRKGKMLIKYDLIYIFFSYKIHLSALATTQH